MKKIVTIFLTISILVIMLISYGCATTGDTAEKQLVAVERGDLSIAVTADGNLSMPHEIKLRFGTPGTVKMVREDLKGQQVSAGILLAKLDDTAQQIAIRAAQYDVELALNELAEKIYPSLLGYPHYYPSFTALLRVEQAQKELDNAIKFFEQGKYSDSAFELRIVHYDLEASLETLQTPITQLDTYPDIAKEYLSDPTNPYGTDYKRLYPAIPLAIDTITKTLTSLSLIQDTFERGNYEQSAKALNQFEIELNSTHGIVNKACGSILRTGISYPDASTSLSIIAQVEDTLHELQSLITEENASTVETAAKIRMALNDIKVSREILEDNELLLKHGLNMKVLRQHNLNFRKAEEALKNAKVELMKTEILAPFDGLIVDIDVKENDQLSAYDYASRVAVHLVDTRTVQLDGVVDEIDIFHVKRGQKAIITVDALPDQRIEGKVTFISPFSKEVAGIVNYPVIIALEPTDIELKGGLTATANIIVDSRENVLYIPNGAIKGTHGDYWVDVMVDKNKDITEEREIIIGIQNNNFAEVISGLTEGEEVVVERTRPTRSIF